MMQALRAPRVAPRTPLPQRPSVRSGATEMDDGRRTADPWTDGDGPWTTGTDHG
jgi:hypothetical protein